MVEWLLGCGRMWELQICLISDKGFALYSLMQANQMNKSRARIEFVEFYTGPAFIHLVCIKLYI